MDYKKNVSQQVPPLLGVARQMFEGDNVYVVNERAEIGKSYSFICPRCHQIFISKTLSNEVKKVKCPNCDTYIYFGSSGEEPEMDGRQTRIDRIAHAVDSHTSGVLTCRKGNSAVEYPLKTGVNIIGRYDEIEKSDISLNDETASRRSVSIEVIKGGQTGKNIYKLVVLRTTNAVFVNKNVLYAGNSVYLNHGDTIRIGTTVFTLM